MSANLKTRLSLDALESREVPASLTGLKPEAPIDAILVGMLRPQPAVSAPQPALKTEAPARAAILVGMLRPVAPAATHGLKVEAPDRAAILVGMLRPPAVQFPAVQRPGGDVHPVVKSDFAGVVPSDPFACGKPSAPAEFADIATPIRVGR